MRDFDDLVGERSHVGIRDGLLDGLVNLVQVSGAHVALELQPEIRVTVIEPGAVSTELTDHITDAQTKQATQAFVRDLAITPQDIAEVIAFALSRPRRMTLNEILVRPTAQVG